MQQREKEKCEKEKQDAEPIGHFAIYTWYIHYLQIWEAAEKLMPPASSPQWA